MQQMKCPVFLSCQANQCKTSRKENIFLEGLEVNHMKISHLENDKESAIKHFRLLICCAQKPGEKCVTAVEVTSNMFVLWGIAKNKIFERLTELN